jgi:lysyl-tRNA synthetase class II
MQMSNFNLSEQEQIRRATLDELRKLGINPYPADEYKTNVFAQDILDNFKAEENNFPAVCLAGRIMNKRIMGNASFAELMDSSGKIQIYDAMISALEKTKQCIILFSKDFLILAILSGLGVMFLKHKWAKQQFMLMNLQF